MVGHRYYTTHTADDTSRCTLVIPALPRLRIIIARDAFFPLCSIQHRPSPTNRTTKYGSSAFIIKTAKKDSEVVHTIGTNPTSKLFAIDVKYEIYSWNTAVPRMWNSPTVEHTV